MRLNQRQRYAKQYIYAVIRNCKVKASVHVWLASMITANESRDCEKATKLKNSKWLKLKTFSLLQFQFKRTWFGRTVFPQSKAAPRGPYRPQRYRRTLFDSVFKANRRAVSVVVWNARSSSRPGGAAAFSLQIPGAGGLMWVAPLGYMRRMSKRSDQHIELLLIKQN